ncbi:MAG: hypothetical protein JWM86_498 [Thermoleophilia bacterium]|nr:hypothetical protein [Thermoleophilia bacterium]
MSAGMPRSAYWILVLAGAMVLLASANAVASSDRGFAGLFGRAKAPNATNKISNSRQGKAVLTVRTTKPGLTGRGRVVLANVGAKPIRRLLLTQDQVKQGGVGKALQLQVFDSTTRKCLYPRPKLRPVRVGVAPPKEPTRCLGWAPFNAGKALRRFSVPSRKGTTWARGEKHAIDVRWRLDTSSPNTDQGRTATFRLLWNATA